MRHLMPIIDPTWWSILSAGVFLVAFAVLTCWVYLPSRRRFYQEQSELPLHKQD